MLIPPLTASRRRFLQGVAAGSASLVLGDYVPALAAGGKGKLPRASPDSLVIDAGAVLSFVEEVEQKVGGLHSLMLLRHGKVAAEGWWAPYAPQHPHMLFSLSKSFTSTAVGLAVQEGRLSVDAPVISFFPDQLPAKVSDNLAAMKVRHLLSMGTGHDKDALGPTRAAADGNWVKAFLGLPVEHAPGSKFVYNSAATYMCSAIVQKLTGQTVLSYLTPRLFNPLGIQNQTWETCPRGISVGGWGLAIKTEDIARFGQLYLQRGAWDGKQLIPAAWVAEATSKHISNGTNPESDWAQGYGYQFWRCRHGAYRGDGAFGQYCVVMPEQDAVLAITSGIRDMQAVLNLAWQHLLPGIGRAAKPMDAYLNKRLSALSVAPPEGKTSTSTAGRYSGKSFRLEPNEEKLESASFNWKEGRGVIALRDGQGEHRIECGGEEWVRGRAPMTSGLTPGPAVLAPMAARGAWEAEDTYTAKLCFYETPFVQTVTCKFTGDQVTITRKMNVGFGPTDRPTLTGKAV